MLMRFMCASAPVLILNDCISIVLSCGGVSSFVCVVVSM